VDGWYDRDLAMQLIEESTARRQEARS